jgi:hypothetical protein
MAAPISEPEPQAAPTASTAVPQSAAASPASSQEQSNQAPATLPSLHADYLNNPAPAYPAQSRQLGEQGKVLLRPAHSSDHSSQTTKKPMAVIYFYPAVCLVAASLNGCTAPMAG